MKGEIYSKGKQSPPTKLNTKGCCFFCLQIVDFKAEGGIKETAKPAIPLRCVSRHLKIKLPKSSTIASFSQESNTEDAPTPKKKEEMEIDLCQSCEEIVNHFSKAFLSLEKFQMEVSYWLGKIHQQISEGSKKPEVVQNYSKRMTSDPETLTQLVLVDNLRKEIAKKSSKREGNLLEGANVKLLRLKSMKKYLRSSKQNDPVDDEDYLSEADNMSAPSPVGITEEDCKTAIDALLPAANNKEMDNEKDYTNSLSPSPPDPVPNITKVSIDGKMYSKNANAGTFDCPICKMQLKTGARAQHHYKSIHLGQRYKCNLCGGSYTFKHSLEKHKTKCDGSAKKVVAKARTKSAFNPETKKYRCVKCLREFAHKQGALRHYDSVHLNKKYKCDICDKVFKQMSYFYSHRKTCKDLLPSRLAKQRTRETNPKYKEACKVCGKKFYAKSHLLRHFRGVHINQQNYRCDLCEKKFKHPIDLKQHKEFIHSKEPFNCEYCKKELRFSKRYSFELHERKCANKHIKIKTEYGQGENP